MPPDSSIFFLTVRKAFSIHILAKLLRLRNADFVRSCLRIERAANKSSDAKYALIAAAATPLSFRSLSWVDSRIVANISTLSNQNPSHFSVSSTPNYFWVHENFRCFYYSRLLNKTLWQIWLRWIQYSVERITSKTELIKKVSNSWTFFYIQLFSHENKNQQREIYSKKKVWAPN